MKAKKHWNFETSGVEGNVILYGVNIFDYEWKSMDRRISVKDPIYNRDFSFSIYSVDIDGKEYEFAAGEFSNGVYGFFVQKY